MNMQLILKDLDKHALESNFPVLDNAYIDMAATRLTVFRGKTDWAILFEVLGFSNREGIFVNDLYAFGPHLKRQGIFSSTPVMFELPDNPMADPATNAWIADWERWSIRVREKRYEFSPTRDEYISQGIEVPSMAGPGSLREAQVMRFFVYREDTHNLFMTEKQLRDELELDSTMKLFIQTEHWQHPDIVGDEQPSSNISMRSLIAALDTGTPTLFDRGHPNTNWKLWNLSSERD